MADANDFFERVGRESADAVRALGEAATRGTRSVQEFGSQFQRVSAAIGGLGYLFKNPVLLGAGAAGALAGGAIGAGAGLAGSASPNGLQSVDKAFEVLSGTIGTMLLPGFVALGGLALVAADSIREWVAGHRVQIIELWTNAIVVSTKAVQEWIDRLNNSTPSERIGNAFSTQEWNPFKKEFWDPAHNANAAPVAPAAPGAIAGAAGIGGGAAGNPLIGKLADKMDMIAKDMQSSVGTSGFTDPASKWKEVAIQIQNSDLEIRKMTMFAESMQLVRDFITELRKQAVPKPAILGGRP